MQVHLGVEEAQQPLVSRVLGKYPHLDVREVSGQELVARSRHHTLAEFLAVASAWDLLPVGPGAGHAPSARSDLVVVRMNPAVVLDEREQALSETVHKLLCLAIPDQGADGRIVVLVRRELLGVSRLERDTQDPECREELR